MLIPPFIFFILTCPYLFCLIYYNRSKPDRIPEVKQVRKELVDKFTFSGIYKDTQEMWEDVAYYIDCTYKKEEIETAFVMGDGAT